MSKKMTKPNNTTMLQNEFEERIGRVVTTEEYAKANAVYMMADDIDKDDFCKEWLNIGSSNVVRLLYEKCNNLTKRVGRLKQLAQKESEQKTNYAVDAMFVILKLAIEARDKSEGEYSSFDAIVVLLDKQIASILGRGKTVILKVRKGIPLSPFDVDYISMNLKIIPHTMENEPIS